jgi:hypothetical protein
MQRRDKNQSYRTEIEWKIADYQTVQCKNQILLQNFTKFSSIIP